MGDNQFNLFNNDFVSKNILKEICDLNIKNDKLLKYNLEKNFSYYYVNFIEKNNIKSKDNNLLLKENYQNFNDDEKKYAILIRILSKEDFEKNDTLDKNPSYIKFE